MSIGYSPKRVLFVTHKFHPDPHISVLRMERFSSYLKTRGWKTIIVTSTPRGNGKEESNVVRIPDPLGKFRVVSQVSNPGSGPRRSSPLARYKRIVAAFARKWLFMPDEQLFWVLAVLFKAGRIIRKYNVTTVVTSSPPPSVNFVGSVMKKLFGVTWIADFRDNWTKNFAGVFPTTMHKRIAVIIENRFFRIADALSYVQPDMIGGDAYKHKARNITNGYSESDFDGVVPRAELSAQFTILYAGSFYGPQSPESFLTAFSRYKECWPVEYKNTFFRFAGVSHDIDVARLARRLDVEDHVDIVGRISHNESVVEMISADALLLIVGKTAGYNTVHTGKLFEYLRAGKPILFLGQANGVVADLLSGHEGCRVVDIDDIESIVDALYTLHKRWTKGKGCRHSETARQFEGEKLAADFAGLIS